MLTPITPGLQPVGFFDAVDADLANIKGGEVMTLASATRANTASETAAFDVRDGYVDAGASRPALTFATNSTHSYLALADEGAGPDYFTLLGTVVGGKTGLVVSGGAANGPHTSQASGKVTVWDRPGIYEVSLDACADGFVAAAVGTLNPGYVLGHTDAGRLAEATLALADTGCAVFVEFTASSSLVTTPKRLVAAVESVDRMKVSFTGVLGNRTVG